jgi:hypothetical protein
MRNSWAALNEGSGNIVIDFNQKIVACAAAKAGKLVFMVLCLSGLKHAPDRYPA